MGEKSLIECHVYLTFPSLELSLTPNSVTVLISWELELGRKKCLNIRVELARQEKMFKEERMDQWRFF